MNNLVSPAGSLFKLENGSLQIHMVYVDIRHEYDVVLIPIQVLPIESLKKTHISHFTVSL